MKFKTFLLFLVLYALGMLLCLNMNSKYRIFTYKSAMWADASGYYMYLPATFIYQWDYNRMPERMDTLTGQGFYLRAKEKIIFTKYTSGQAYLHLPFFLAAHVYCMIADIPADGFSQPYVNSLLFAGVFYMLAGLFFLYSVLRKYFTKRVCILTLVGLFACTNLYYYAIKHPGLSHIYTFFLVAVILWLIQYFSAKKLIFILALSALIVLIRPTNLSLLVLMLVFGLSIHGWNVLKKVPVKFYVIGIILAFLILLPQFLYWHYASGKWLMYSYENEGFIFWNRPHISEVLIAARNGFFTYSPIMLLAIFGFVFKPLGKQFSIAVIVFFSLITYIHASWHSPGFGCAYGGRAFIDFYPVFAIGLAAFINYVLLQKRAIQWIGLLVMVCFAAYNILFIYRYDDCWRSYAWDYNRILMILEGSLPQ